MCIEHRSGRERLAKRSGRRSLEAFQVVTAIWAAAMKTAWFATWSVIAAASGPSFPPVTTRSACSLRSMAVIHTCAVPSRSAMSAVRRAYFSASVTFHSHAYLFAGRSSSVSPSSSRNHFWTVGRCTIFALEYT